MAVSKEEQVSEQEIRQNLRRLLDRRRSNDLLLQLRERVLQEEEQVEQQGEQTQGVAATASLFPVDPTPDQVAERFGFAPQVGAPAFIQELLSTTREVVRESPDASNEEVVLGAVERIESAGGVVPVEVGQFLDTAVEFAREIEQRPATFGSALLRTAQDLQVQGGEDPRVRLGRRVEEPAAAEPQALTEADELQARANELRQKKGDLTPRDFFKIHEEVMGRVTDPDQMVGRFAAGFAQEVIDLGQGVVNEAVLRNLERPTVASDGRVLWERPVLAFDLVRKWEQEGILKEATAMEHWSQLTGQATAAIAPIVAATGGLGLGAAASRAPQAVGSLLKTGPRSAAAIDRALGASVRLGPVNLGGLAQVSDAAAQTFMLSLQSMLTARQALRNQGLEPDEFLRPDDYAEIARGSASIPLLGAAGNALVQATNAARRTPLGAVATKAVHAAWFSGAETALGVTVRGQSVPEAVEHGTSLAVALLLTGGYDVLFKASHRPRTPEGAREGLDITRDIIVQRGMVEAQQRPPRATVNAEQRLSTARARAALQNLRASVVGRGEKLQPGGERARKVAEIYGVSEPTVARLITEVNRMSPKSLEAIREHKVKEAMVALTEQLSGESPAVTDLATTIMRNQLGLLSRPEQAIWLSRRRRLVAAKEREASAEDLRRAEDLVEGITPEFAREMLKTDPVLRSMIEGVVETDAVVRVHEKITQAEQQRQAARFERQAKQIEADARRLAEIQRTEQQLSGEAAQAELIRRKQGLTAAEAAKLPPTAERRPERLLEGGVPPERRVGFESPEPPVTELPRGERTRFVRPTGEVVSSVKPKQVPGPAKPKRKGAASDPKTLRKQLVELGFDAAEARRIARNPAAAQEILRRGKGPVSVVEPELTAAQEARLGRRAGRQEKRRRLRRAIEAPEVTAPFGAGEATMGEVKFVLRQTGETRKFERVEAPELKEFTMAGKPPSPLVQRFIQRAGKVPQGPTERVMRAIVKANEILGKQAFETVEFSRNDPKAEAIVDMIDRQRLPREYRDAFRAAEKTLEQERREIQDRFLDRLTSKELQVPVVAFGVLSGGAAVAAIDEDDVDPRVGLAALPFWALFGKRHKKPTTLEKEYARALNEASALRQRAEAIEKSQVTEARLARKNPRKIERVSGVMEKVDYGDALHSVQPFVVKVKRPDGKVISLSGPLLRRMLRVNPEAVQRLTPTGSLEAQKNTRGAVLSILTELKKLGPGGEIMGVALGDAIENTNARRNRLRGVLENPGSFEYAEWQEISGRSARTFASEVETLGVGTATKTAARRLAGKRSVTDQIADAVEKGITPEHPEAIWRAEVINRVKFGIANAKHIGVKRGSALEKDVENFIQIWNDHMGGMGAEAQRFGLFDQLLLEEGGSYVPLIWNPRVYEPSAIEQKVKWAVDIVPTPGKKSSLSKEYLSLKDRAAEARQRVFEDAKERGIKMWEQVARFDSKEDAQAWVKKNLPEERGDNVSIRKITMLDLRPQKIGKSQVGRWTVEWRRPITEGDINEYFSAQDNMRFEPILNRPIDQLRARTGFLDNHRLLGNVGVERVWDPVELMTKYLDSAYARIEEARAFKGKDLPLAQESLEAMRKQNEVASERARLLVDVARGVHPTWTRNQRTQTEKFFQQVSSAVSIRELGLAGASQLTSWARIPIHTDFVSSYRGMFDRGQKALSQLDIGPKGSRDKIAKQEYDRFIAEHGHQIQSEWGVLIRDGSLFFPKVASAYLQYNGTLPIDSIGRQGSVLAGRHYFRVLRMQYMDAVRSGHAKRTALALSRIRELFDDPGIAKLATKRGKLNELEMGMLERLAGSKVAARTSGRTEIVDMPLLAEHPYGQFLYKFMHFPFRMQAESLNELSRFRRFTWSAKDKATMLRKLALFAAITGGVSPGIQRLRSIIKGRDGELSNEDETLLTQWLDFMAYAGYHSAIIDTYNGIFLDRYNGKTPRFFGPVAENLLEGLEAARHSVTRGHYPVAAWVIGWTPEPVRSWMHVHDKQREWLLEDPETLLERMGLVPNRVQERGTQ